MLVLKYYKWNGERNVYELHTERCSEIYSEDNTNILCLLENSDELISLRVDHLISIKPVN